MSTLQIDSLLALHAAGEMGLPLDTLLADLRRGRHRGLSVPQLETALRTHLDKIFANVFDDEVSGKRWHITARGKSALEVAGLV